MATLVGRQIGEYRLETPLGAGVIGETYRAAHIRTSAAAAVKIIHTRLTAEPEFGKRFRKLLTTLATLHAPHILSIREFGEYQAQYFIITDLVTGGSLRELLQRRSKELPLWRGVDVIRQALDGLSSIHAQRICHQDLKPENILLDRGGQATTRGKASLPSGRLADAALMQLSETGATVGGNMPFGSPVYISPEQCRGSVLDARSDIYSMGVVLYEVATGYPPFHIKTLGDAVEKHLHTTPPAPRSVAPTLPPALDALILRCLAKKPDDRFASATELAAALDPIAAAITPPPAPEVVLRDERPRPIVALRDDRPPTVAAPAGPKVVMRDESVVEPLATSLGGSGPPAGAPAGSPDPKIRVILGSTDLAPPARKTESPSTAAPSGEPGLRIIGPPPEAPGGLQSKAADAGTLMDLPLRVQRRPTTPEMRPSMLPPDLDEGGGGVGPARRSRRIAVAIQPEVLTLSVGVPAIVRVTIANTGHVVDHFLVTVEGVPDGWVELPHKPAQLNPGGRTTVPLKVLVPRACVNRAGDYHVAIRATSRDKPEESVAAEGRWTVTTFAASSVTLAPQRVTAWRRAALQATIANDGNSPAEFSLRATDEEQRLRCTFTPPTTTLEPCGRASVGIAATVPIRWIGTVQSRPFTVRAERAAAEGEAVPQGAPAVAQGQFVHRPIIPIWVPPLLALLGMCILLLLRTRGGLHLTVSPAAVQVAINSKVPLTGSVVNPRSEVMPDHPVVWLSRDTTIAVVSDSGIVTGRREGQTEIIATSGRMQSAVQVSVVAAQVATIVVSPKSEALKLGSTSVLHATTKDANGIALKRDVIWTSSDPTVATVGGDGRVTAKAAGSATITAMADSKTGTADITIAALPPGETQTGTDDCVGYDPASLKVVDEKAMGWGVNDGSKDIATLDNQTDAGRALALARAYKRHCYLGRANTRPDRSDYIIEYWDGASGVAPVIDVEDCYRYNRQNLRVQEVSGQGWMLTDGKQPLTMVDTQADGKRAWDLALGNSEFCFIGRGNRRQNHRDYVVQYWKQ
jgi:serine/threonine protein kinase